MANKVKKFKLDEEPKKKKIKRQRVKDNSNEWCYGEEEILIQRKYTK